MSDSAEAKPERIWPTPLVAWYSVGVLTFAYLVSFVDRQILSLLIEPIRADLEISDTQISLLGGFAFAVLYTTVGIPIAWLADHRSRRMIISAGIAVWTVMTALCGLAQTFWQMFAARVGVGVGEAALTPSAFSMLSDTFPPNRLARPMGVYMAGGAMGAGMALIVGGAVLAATEALPTVAVPLLGALKPWQFAFVLVALPGVLAMLLVLSLREPARRGRLDGSPTGAPVSPRAAIGYVARRWRIYLPLLGGFALLALFKNAILMWAPTLYIRTFGWTASEIGFAYGLCLLVFGIAGAVGGGWLVDWLRGRGMLDGAPRVAVATMLLCAPAGALMPLMPNAALSLALLALVTMLGFVIAAIVPTALQLVTPNEMRAQVSAVAQFSNNLLGIAFGPTLVALITDFGFGYDDALRFSMAAVSLTIAPLGALSFGLGIRHFRIENGRLHGPNG